MNLFLDDTTPVPPLISESPYFKKRNGQFPDVSVCKAKWATSEKLKKWYKCIHDEYIAYRKAHDTSGTHDFVFDGRLSTITDQDCFKRFTQRAGKTATMPIWYLFAISVFRQDTALDFFSSYIPNHEEIGVDGMSPDNAIALDTESSSESSGDEQNKRQKTGADNNNVITMNHSAEEKKLMAARAAQIEQMTKRDALLSSADILKKQCEATRELSDSMNHIAANVADLQKKINKCKDSDIEWASNLQSMRETLKHRMVGLVATNMAVTPVGTPTTLNLADTIPVHKTTTSNAE